MNFEENQTNAGQFSVPGDRARRGVLSTVKSWLGLDRPACQYTLYNDKYNTKVFKLDLVHFPIIFLKFEFLNFI